MKTKISACEVVLAAALVGFAAAPAHAWPKTYLPPRSTWPKPPAGAPGPASPVVGSWSYSPSAAPPGGVITLRGPGIATAGIKVTLAGTALKVTRQGNQLTMTVPKGAKTGALAVVLPGKSPPLELGRFEVEGPVIIGAFEPALGPAGTKVVLHGSGFKPGDNVAIGGVAVPSPRIESDSITFVVPSGARPGPITISRNGGRPAGSKKSFDVLPPIPSIATYAPAAGPPGTEVTLTLRDSSVEGTVSYGDLPATIVSRTPSMIVVRVPDKATKSAIFSVSNRTGKGLAPGQFTLLIAASLEKFLPATGVPGQPVTIFGEHFQAGDEIRLNGKKLEIQSLAEKQIVVVLPKNAESGKFVHRRGKVETTMKQPFLVLVPPVVTSFSPASGPATTRVVLTGRGLSEDAEISYGSRALKVLARKGDSELTVMIPPGAEDGPFTVKTRAGTTRSSKSFQVVTLSSITGVSPTSAPVGSRVVIRGKDFSGTDAFFLGDAQLTIVDRSGDGYTVEIPAGAKTGEIEWVSHGVRRKSGITLKIQ